MVYTETSNKNVQELVNEIESKISNYKFGVLHIHNVAKTLESKGVEFNEECQILDICNPNYAKLLLESDMTLSSIMPCKISVYSKNNQTYISMNSIVQLVDDINPDLIEEAQEIQSILLELIEEVK
ncbi:DUF302 domain-containing protein [Arcobacter sp. YIC-310]|uniref:DUF302 domain-containing protein n=1 Tax=Arcobacter sp. YIC-310 TaxID=3376632 RepID=UPI003C18F4B5